MDCPEHARKSAFDFAVKPDSNWEVKKGKHFNKSDHLLSSIFKSYEEAL